MAAPAPPQPRPLAAGHVLVAMVIALLGGALLNAQAILRTAQQQELGTGRSVALAFAEPLAAMSEALRLDMPRAAIDEALGREAPRRDVTAVPTTTTSTVPDTSPAVTTTTTIPR
ncbi:MAG: hypothetical protein HKO70_11710, partial [Acidimicrobiia bacterium]|nr:hypothetical protein [Acidimicrobiia bacterium]